jgi:hypothetical protein
MPQDSYKSDAKADHLRYVGDVDLQPVIEFNREPYPYGIPLRDALSGRLKKIPEDCILNHGPPSAYIRLQVSFSLSLSFCSKPRSQPLY